MLLCFICLKLVSEVRVCAAAAQAPFLKLLVRTVHCFTRPLPAYNCAPSSAGCRHCLLSLPTCADADCCAFLCCVFYARQLLEAGASAAVPATHSGLLPLHFVAISAADLSTAASRKQFTTDCASIYGILNRQFSDSRPGSSCGLAIAAWC